LRDGGEGTDHDEADTVAVEHLEQVLEWCWTGAHPGVAFAASATALRR
jgi:hypothetical protein